MSVIPFLLELKELSIFVNKTDEKLAVKGNKEALNQEIKKQLGANKQAIIDCYQQFGLSSNKQLAPVSFTQRRLWFIDKLGGGSREYNQSSTLNLSGQLNIDALNQAFNHIMQRHQSLRTNFIEDNGEPYQRILPWSESQLEVVDLTVLKGDEQQQTFVNMARDFGDGDFDLANHMMMRAKVVKLNDDSSVLMYGLHHIASDGWSLGILEREFSALFNAFSQGLESPLEPLTIQYSDYAHWQRNFFLGEVFEQHLDFWTNQLKGIPELHSLPLDKPRPERLSRKGGEYTSVIDKQTTDKLSSLCLEQKATLFMGLHSITAMVIAYFSGESDIVIGTPIANREQAGIDGLIGYFVNTLVLRSHVDAKLCFRQLLNQNSKTAYGAYQYQQLPFEALVDRLQIRRATSYDPVFQIMLVLQNNEQVSTSLSGLDTQTQGYGEVRALFDMLINIAQFPEGLFITWNYSSDIFAPQTIERMAKCCELFLKAALAEPDKPIGQLSLLDLQTQTDIKALNPPLTWQNQGLCASDLFAQQVAKNPQKAALVAVVDGQSEQLTYDQLNRYANQLARHLRNIGVSNGDVVGVSVERSFHMLIAICAIHKAGAAYVPMDANLPVDRLEFICQDAAIKVVLTQQDDFAIQGVDGVNLLAENLVSTLQQLADSNLDDIELNSDDLAYVIYTSGSTGQPKGVMVTHNNLLSYVDAATDTYSITCDDRMLQFSSPAFDIFVEEVFVSLLSGATLVLRTEQVMQGGNVFWQFIADQQISVLSLPTAFWHLLAGMLDEQSAALGAKVRLLIIGGEKMEAGMLTHWQQFMPKSLRLLNTYGPTETTIVASTFDATEFDPNDGEVPLGKPLGNCQLYIVDEQNRLAPVGVFGELMIGGQGVTKGYLNRDDLTTASFVDDFINQSSDKLFRTGDIARFNHDGNIEFRGRADNQVKIRGFRIELGEIEHRLNQVEGVDLSVVMTIDDSGSDKQLIAYLQSDKDTDTSDLPDWVEKVRRQVATQLPVYMVPTYFVHIDKLPLTDNGKVDKRALPGKEAAIRIGEFKAAQTETEIALRDMWVEILSLPDDKVSISASFFDLGGHSLLLVRLLSHIKSYFGLELSLESVYNDVTIEAIASMIDLALLRLNAEQDDGDDEDMEDMEW